jgi:hypothetical protein
VGSVLVLRDSSKAVSDDINEKKKVAEVLNRCGWMMAGCGGFQ